MGWNRDGSWKSSWTFIPLRHFAPLMGFFSVPFRKWTSYNLSGGNEANESVPGFKNSLWTRYCRWVGVFPSGLYHLGVKKKTTTVFWWNYALCHTVVKAVYSLEGQKGAIVTSPSVLMRIEFVIQRKQRYVVLCFMLLFFFFYCWKYTVPEKRLDTL